MGPESNHKILPLTDYQLYQLLLSNARTNIYTSHDGSKQVG